MNRKISPFILAILIIGIPQTVLSQVINHETRISIDANNLKTTERTILILVNDKQSNWLSNIEIGHDPKQDFSFNNARIIDAQGNTVRKLKKKDLSTRNDLSYQAFYQDNLITEFDLYWNEYPYRIEYSYTITEKEYLFVAWWTPQLFLNVPTLKSSLEIEVPVDYIIHINQSNPLTYKESKTEDSKTYRWVAKMPKTLKDEIYSPPKRELIPLVSVVPSDFSYGVNGNTESWSSFGLWKEQLLEGTNDLPYSEKLIVNELINGITNKKEIVKTIYYYLQDHTKYIFVAIDFGGLKSYPASYVCQNKYGDCKALTTYMQSMLKSVGIDSYYTTIYAGDNPVRVNADFPSHQSNHVILSVPLENDTLWLENTSNSLPFNYLGTFTQNRFALAINGENSALIRTPKMNVSDVLVERNYEFVEGEENTWIASILGNLRGNDFENFRYSKTNQEAEQVKLVTSFIEIEGFDLSEWNTINFSRDSANVKIQVNGACSNLIREVGKLQVINPLKISLPDFEEPQKRLYDVRINFPINKADKTAFHFKSLADKEVTLPKAASINSPYGKYSSSYSVMNNSIEINEKFTLFDNQIPIAKYNEFYSFLQSIINHKKKSAILIK